jgi:hypothetical protein
LNIISQIHFDFRIIGGYFFPYVGQNQPEAQDSAVSLSHTASAAVAVVSIFMLYRVAKENVELL